VKETYVLLLSRIGSPIDKPMMASAQVLLEHGKRIREAAPKFKNVIRRGLASIEKLCFEISEGRHPVC
jgi:S-adenosylmethionine synthetase